MSNQLKRKTVDIIKTLLNGIEKFDESVAAYKESVRAEVLPSFAFVSYSHYLYTKNKKAEARKLLEAAILMPNPTSMAYIDLGLLEKSCGNIKRALELFEKAYSIDKKNIKLLCIMAEVSCEKKEFDKAEEFYKEANKINPLEPAVLLQWGLALYKQGLLVLASEKFKAAAMLTPENGYAIYLWAIVDLELGNYEAAREKFDAIVRVNRNNPDVYYYIANSYYMEDNYKKAILNLRKVFRLTKKKKSAYLLMSNIYLLLKDKEKMLKYLLEAEKEGLADAELYSYWGSFLIEFEDFEQGLEILNKSKEDSNYKNDDNYAYEILANVGLKKLDEACKIFEEHKDLLKENWIMNNAAGQLMIAQGDILQAVKYFNAALKLSSKSYENYLYLARCYSILGNENESDEYYEKALKYQINNLDIYIEYVKILTNRGDYNLAKRKINIGLSKYSKNLELLNYKFYVSYMVAKESRYGYNVKEALDIAKEIEDFNSEGFEYSKEKVELENFLIEVKGEG